MDTLLGKTIDRYRIEKLLGRGGMGAVYQGVDTENGQWVAVKVMTEDFGDMEEVRRRFDREAKVASEINHPNVARVMGNGVSDGVRYLVMEFIDGQPLSESLKHKGWLPARQALGYVAQTARGLDAALACGSIHRDIKPENIMVTRKGVIKIVDFGLAKNESTDSFRTATGAVMGTPHYMSPEQATGRPVDHRSDIYSLGATLYHLLTGRTPFSGENAIEIIQCHVRDEVAAIEKWNSEVPAPVCQIVYRMLKKRPDERFQTYGHLIKMLEDAMAGREAPSMTMDIVDEAEIRTAEASSAGDFKRLVLAGAAVLIVVGGAIGFHYSRLAQEDAEAGLTLTQKETINGVTELRRDSFRTETVPMLHDISKFMKEQDREVSEFGSRRERMNQ